MIKQIYILLVILSVSISFYSCDDFGVEPRETNNLTYKIIGNSSTSNEEGISITRLNDSYILGGMTNIALTKDYMLAKTDKDGQVEFSFNAGIPLKDDALSQVVVTNTSNNELFVLLNQESEQSFKETPALAKITYTDPDSNTTLGSSIFLERENIVNENDVIRENSVEAIYLEGSGEFLVLSNIIEKDNEKIRLTLVNESTGDKVWSRVYSLDNGTGNPPSLEGIGIIEKNSGNFTVMGNMSTEEINGDITVKVFALEVDNLGNEVTVKFPISTEALIDFTTIATDEYALITTSIDGNDIKNKDIKTYTYNISSNALTNVDILKNTESNNDDIIGKTIQRIGGNIIITAIETSSSEEWNQAVIYKLGLDLKEDWKNYYYYSESSINRLDIGNAIERIGGGYAVIGTHDLKSSTKMVLLLLDEEGNYIDN